MWVNRAQRGDKDAFGAIVRQFQDMAVGYAYSVLLDFDLAQDAAQDAFVQAYRDLPKLRDPQAFPAWFRRVVFTHCTRSLRGRRVPTAPIELLTDVAAPGGDPYQAAEVGETRRTVRDAIRALPDHERSATTLFYIGGYSHVEIGDFLGVPVTTVKNRLFSARARLRERMMAMVEQTMKSNAPGEAFGRKVIEGIEKLQWGKSGDCTFAGALAVATSVTPHPFDYQTIMGVTGLAFRVRWFQGPGPRWCPSSPVGEFPDEMRAAAEATGWALRTEVRMDRHDPHMEEFAPQVVASLDAGLPVLAYDKQMNMAVITGYDDGGRTYLMNGYMADAQTPVPASEIGPMLVFLGENRGPLPPREAALAGLRLALSKARQRHDPEGNLERGYWMGPAGLGKWREDLGLADSLTEEERGFLFFVSWWCFGSLADARFQAAPFLRQSAALFPQSARPALTRAAELYEQEGALLSRTFVRKDVFLGPYTGKTINDWTPEVRAAEQDILAKAAEIEAQALDALAEAVGG